jgi:hypothetical protein
VRCFGHAKLKKLKNAKIPAAARLMALALCAVYIAAFLFSAAYILVHASHAHDSAGPDGSCAACARLAAAGGLLKSVSAAAAGGAPAAAWGTSGIFSLPKPAVSRAGLSTLVCLKVRLNN